MTGDLVRGPRKKKYHLCICGREGAYLFICSNGYEHDFAIRNADCHGVPNFVSYISAGRIIRKTDFSKRAKVVCTVNDIFLQGLLDHLAATPVLPEAERAILCDLLSRHLD
ncbi:hypothetical protein [Brevundimonas sp.]|uniref:hypothetical protein n=1 Tax=Brevundimonas sp. TaxID=1871086 RepID=UPI002FC65849